jgi:hypothetical protein
VHAPAIAHVLLDEVTANQCHELWPHRSVRYGYQPTGRRQTYIASRND